MDASQLFKAGKLTEAIDAQIAIVKANPADSGQRLFLYELFVFAGDLDRAKKQIDAITPEQPEIAVAILEYRNLLDAERSRRQVFAEKAQPGFLSPPGEHVQLRLLGLMKLADGDLPAAADLFHQANDQVPEIKGKLNDQPFDGLRDGDDCLGSVLEVLVNGRYFWVPLEQVQSLSMKAPRFPRDLLWIPAQLEMKEGEAGDAFLPVLYAGTEKESDPQLKLGRMTDWRGEDLVRGVGARTFFVGTDESSLLDWRKLELT